MAFWHSSPLLSDGITGKAKLWSRPSTKHTSDAVYTTGDARGRQSRWSRRFITNFGFFLHRLLLHGTGGIITFLVGSLFPPFFCPIYSFSRLFVLPSPADFILVTYFQFFIKPLIAPESMAGGASASTFNIAHKGQKMEQQCALGMHCPSSPGTLRDHSETTQRTLRDHSEMTQKSLRDHSKITQRPFREHSENTQRTLREN